MGKKLKKEIQNLKKTPHPKSRKTAQISRKVTRASKKAKTKLQHFMKLNLMGERLLWFRDHLKSVDVYTPELTTKLIESYLKRFNEELEQINIKHSTGKRKGRQHANREDIIRMTIKNEKNEFETCGIEMVDILNQQQLNLLKNWTGELRFLQNFKMIRYSKSGLEKLNKFEVPVIIGMEKESDKEKNFQCDSSVNQSTLDENTNKEEYKSDCEIEKNNVLNMEVDK